MLKAGDLLSTGLLFSAICFAAAVGLTAFRPRARGGRLAGNGQVFALHALAAGVTWFLLGGGALTLLPLGLSTALVTVSLLWLNDDFSPLGRILLLSHVQLVAWGLPWGIWFISTIPVSAVTRALMFAGYPFIILTLPVGLVSTFEAWEVLCRRRWLRPRLPLQPTPRACYPKVSLHVPECSEPPEVVIATLDALARLDYPNFEVLVVDNNTREEALWRPVEAHCRMLGERFRFYRLEHCQGAKAGALNFALRHTAQDADLVGVVDSDYHAQPDFLASLVGFFDDPRMGFVQTPHDYRKCEHSTYLRWCRWEYKYFFNTTMVSLNERDSAIIVGTMCLIRRRALEEAGGWSEWCLTEDSELAIRIHAAGYSSVYLATTFGRGLIPETFSGYRRQRFRWTYGPIQELKAHLGLFLPRPFGRRSALSRAHKVHHLNHGLDRLNIGLALLLMPVGVATIGSMVAHREVIAVPLALWAAATAVLIGDFVLKWVTYRSMGCRLGDTVGALIASRALSHTITMASLAALLSRPARWQRTSKFKALPRMLSELYEVRVELLLGMGALAFAASMFFLLPQSGLLTMLLIGAIYQSVNYLAAPAMALLAARDLARDAAAASSSHDAMVSAPALAHEASAGLPSAPA